MRRIALYGLVSIIAASCGPTIVFQQMEPIPNAMWEQGHRTKYSVEIPSAMQPYNLLLEIRHTGNYPFSNLFVFMNTKFPDGRSRTDTIDCLLAKPSGEWYGSGLGDLYSLSIPFRKNVRFNLEGTYIFEIEHGMRGSDPLAGISDIGLTLEKK